VRLAIASLLGRDGNAAARPVDLADPLGALGDDLARAVERMDADDALGLPQPGSGYEPVELTPALRARRDGALAELLEAQGRQRERRTRVRRARVRARVAFAGATALLLVFATAGASALIDFSTGISEVDQLLGTYRAAKQEAGKDPSSGSPEPGQATVSLAAPPIEGVPQRYLVAYRSQAGDVCEVLSESKRLVDSPIGSGGCILEADLARELTGKDAVISGSSFGEGTVTLTGYAQGDAEEIHVQGPNGSLETRVSELWLPADGAGERLPLRIFAAVGKVSATNPADVDREMDFRNYEITVQEGE
jgi:hypothetical protein